jgi:hypothetical protein
MGYSGKWGEKLQAQTLRRRGLSYKEILKHVNVSKSTLSTWCRDIELTDRQRERLYNRKGAGQRKGSVIAARNKQLKRWADEKRLRELGIKDVGRLNKNQRFLVGIALYAAEGYKSGRSGISFPNSDQRMVKFMMSWLREFCKVPESKFKGALWIHDNLDEAKARKFWSDITRIPLNQFHKSYIVKNKVGSKKIRKQKHEHGVFTVRFSDVKLKRRLNGWIDGVLS